jgi:hypothetical protein
MRYVYFLLGGVVVLILLWVAFIWVLCRYYSGKPRQRFADHPQESAYQGEPGLEGPDPNLSIDAKAEARANKAAERAMNDHGIQ